MGTDEVLQLERGRPNLREQILGGVSLDRVTLVELCRRGSAYLDGAGVELRLEDDDASAAAEASDDVAGWIAATQATLGQGPTIEALRRHRTVLTEDLGADDRWPDLAAALAGQRRAALAVPLAIDGAQIGALSVYLPLAGPISGTTVVHATHLATVMTGIVLSLPITDAVDDGLAATISVAVAGQSKIHQAAGVVSVHEDCSLAEAMLKLRAYAYANDQLVSEVAGAVIDRGLRLR